MGRNIRSIMMAGGLALITVGMLSGCAKGDRSSGQYIDDRMTARKVKSELKNNPIYKFDEVNVNTYRGVVQLSGWVEEPEQKQIAENIAKRTPGVIDVVNNLTLKPHFQLVPTGPSATGRPQYELQQERGTDRSTEPTAPQPRAQPQP